LSFDEAFLLDLVRALRSVGLEAVIVGATGAYLQGAPVMTRDIDLLVRDTPKNRAKIDRIGEVLGTGRPVELSELSKVLRLVGARVPIDFLFDTMAGDLSFASVRSRSVTKTIGSETVTIASLEDIIRSKEVAGRPKDLAMLPILRDALRVKKALEEL
jgi:hypothetical protein